MRPVKRSHVNKAKSAARFRHQTGRTKVANVKAPMRGGIRM